MAKIEQFTWVDSHQWTIQGYKWVPEKPKAVVQLVHGMTEHALRYVQLAEFLNQAGIAVYAHDHRGHGLTGRLNLPMGFLGGTGWKSMVKNIHDVNIRIQKEHPHLPIFMLGHSMGSYLAQVYASRHSQCVEGLLLSGTSFEPKLLTWTGLMVAKLLRYIRGPKASGAFFYNIIYGGFNRPFSPARTAFDWLSCDQKEVDSYIQDSLCGFVPPISFFEALFGGLYKLYGKKEYRMLSKTLPLYFFSGEKDPLGKNTQSVKKLITIYQGRGNPVKWAFYPEGRHVMLAETNVKEVQLNLLEWIETQLRRSQ